MYNRVEVVYGGERIILKIWIKKKENWKLVSYICSLGIWKKNNE